MTTQALTPAQIKFIIDGLIEARETHLINIARIEKTTPVIRSCAGAGAGAGGLDVSEDFVKDYNLKTLRGYVVDLDKQILEWNNKSSS